MTHRDGWQDLARALAERQTDGPVRFWLRDDDAIEPTPQLDRLLALCETHAVPLALAVIPAGAGPALAHRLENHPGVTPILHGWSHANHAAAGEKKQELGAHRPAAAVLDDLRKGLARLHELFGDRLEPLLVPPWNRIAGAVVSGLRESGFTGLSTFGLPSRPAPIVCVNATVDIIDWHGTRGCRDPLAIMTEIADQVRQGYGGKGRPAIGILTHHLIHDDAVWVFLERLFSTCSLQASCRWSTIRELLGEASGVSTVRP